ncbi:MAG: LPS export ABC transporter periplasmic protein LptC [Armatimonadota bacterium]|nr:LPS export ABC transporter periplasmic protein LptC [Armatimonadota bacterium]
MKRFTAPSISISLIALIVLSFIWLKDYRPFGRVAKAPDISNIGLRLHGAKLIGRTHGKQTWKLDSRLVEVSSDRGYIHLANIKNGVVYDKKGRQALTISSQKVVYNAYSKDISATGKTKVVTNRNMSIATDKLAWNAYQEKLVCPGHVTIDMGVGKGSAGGLVVDMKNNSLTLKKVNINIPAKEGALRIY